MKILHVVRTYYPAVGGNQTHIKELSEALVKYGENITVFTSTALNETELNNSHCRKKKEA